MTITIIGASSGVGLLAVQQTLAQGHHVTTLSRTVATLPEHPHLTKVVGSATVAADLRRVLPGAEAVLITVGTANKNATPLSTDTARALLEATADGTRISTNGFRSRCQCELSELVDAPGYPLLYAARIRQQDATGRATSRQQPTLGAGAARHAHQWSPSSVPGAT
jgi:putative NADH-flavin reductase